MLYFRVTRGYVRQHFDSETGQPVQQEFIPDESAGAYREDEEGNPIPEDQQVELANTEKEFPMDMVQP